LLAATTEGDEVAFAVLVTRFQDLVVRTALRVTRSRDDAEDAAQQTWLSLFEHAAQIQSPEALPGWLTTTVRREGLRLVSRRERTLPLDVAALAQVPDPGDGPDLQAERHETAQQVNQALDQLPLSAAQLLVQLVGLARPYAEVSRELGRPMGSLGPLRARYLRQLSDLLDG